MPTTKTDSTTWDFSRLFKNPTPAAIKAELARVKRESDKFVKKWEKRKDYLEKSKVLRQALDEYNEWSETTGTSGKAGYYVWLRSNQDLNDAAIKALQNQIRDVASALSNKLQFFTLRLGKISPAKQKEFLKSKELLLYRHFLARLFAEAKHDLSEAEEKIMTLKAPLGYDNWHTMLEGFLSKETHEGKTLMEWTSHLSSPERSVRHQAGTVLEGMFAKNASVAEHELNAILQNKKINDELRGFARPDSSRHLAEDVDTKVVDTLISTVASRFAIPKRYYALKAKLLGLADFNYYDRNAQLPGVEKKYPLAQAKEIIGRSLAQLDPEFAEIFNRFFAEGLVDVYPYPNKRGGAFCAYELKSLPTYILLNHQDRLRDVTTLAHEVGHGINDELMKQAQPGVYFGTPMATAEVASTFMEDFALAEITKDLTEEEQLNSNLTKLDDDMATIFRQIACYRCEFELHQTFRQKGYLSQDEISQIFKKHMASYLGAAAEKSDLWWVYWSHLRYYFYVYSYASGLLISKALQAKVKKDPTFIKEVKTFLSAGLSDSPKNLFAKMGLDITKKSFWDRGLDEVEQLLDDTEALAKKLGKT